MTEPRVHAVHVTPRSDGADLDVTPYVRHLLTDLFALLADPDRPELMDDLCAIVDGTTPAPDPYQPERHMPTEDLVERLTGLLQTTIRQYRPELAVLAGTLGRIARAQSRRPLGSVPEQRGGEAA